MKVPISTSSWIIIIFSTILITMFLFFIDEGYYDFRWMSGIGNWLIIMFYAAFIFSGEFILFLFLRDFKNRFRKWFAIIFFGAAIGFLIAVTLVFK